MLPALSDNDEKRFNQLEKIIEKGISHFVEVGTALMVIKQEKLYKLVFSTFKEYCQQRWGFNSSRARQLIASAKINKNLKSVTMVTPTRERQTRPLTYLEPEQQKEVWDKAVKTAPQEDPLYNSSIYVFACEGIVRDINRFTHSYHPTLIDHG